MNQPPHFGSSHHPAPARMPGPAVPPGQQQQQFDPWIIWVTFRRCWHWAVPTGAVLAAIAAFFVVQTFEPKYEASALLEANDDFILQKIFLATSGDDDLAKTEKPLIFDRIVLDSVLADPTLKSAPSLSDPETAEANLRKNLSVNSAGSDKRMSLTYQDTDKQAAADVCNAVVRSYLARRDEFDNQRVNNLEQWLAPEIRAWEDEVEKQQKKVQALSKDIVGYSPGEMAATNEDQGMFALLNSLREQITELEVEMSLDQAVNNMRGEYLQEAATEELPVPEFVPPVITVERIEPTETEIDAFVERDKEVIEAQEWVDFYKQQMLSMIADRTDRIRKEEYQDLQAKHAQRLALLERAKEKARPRVLENLNQQADEDYQRRQREAEMQIANAKAQYEAEVAQARRDRKLEIGNELMQSDFDRGASQARLDFLKQKYNEERRRLEQMGSDTATLQFLNDDLRVAKDVLVQLRSRVAAIRTERQKGGTVRALANAKPPRTPVETVPIKKMVAASGAVFFLPFLLGLLWEFKVQRVTDSSVVEKAGTLAPLVGEVTRLPSGTEPGKGRRLFEESIETLRANLFLSVQTRDTRTIAVASSMSGEGKSSVASQLAISIARASGETVLLVDADLRCPDQHEIFGLDLGKGLCGVLSGEVTLSEAVDTSLGELVHVLPAGQLSTSPHRLMSPSSMRDFFDEAKQKYTYVVVDTAPVLAAGETLAVSSAVDATLLCVMRDVSRMESVNKTTQRLNAAGANVAGTVFSGVAPRKYAYRYGDYQYALAGDA